MDNTELIPLELSNSRRDTIRKAREAFLPCHVLSKYWALHLPFLAFELIL